METESEKPRLLVTGAGGFIGHHLVKFLKNQRHWVRGVDVREPQFEPSPADEFLLTDLRSIENSVRAVQGVREVYHLAADMGGIGYITENHASLSRNNTLINSNMLEACRLEGVDRYLFTSSACVYPSFLQDREDTAPLAEDGAIPADPEKGYGWEKLFAEQLATYFHEDFGLDIRLVRLHNVYGPLGTYEGGREKAPAAISRKVAEAEAGSVINIWGDGKQTRSFCYVRDCVEGLTRIMDSGYVEPVNLGTEELVTIDDLFDVVSDVAQKDLERRYDTSKPQGVRGRNSDNRLLRKIVDWEPTTPLRLGIGETYAWVWKQLALQDRAKPPAPPVLDLQIR